jgi:hypothetical protein
MALRPNANRPFEDDDDDFYNSKAGVSETQRLLVREQDETISSLASTVERVQGMAVLVNEELSAQNRLLDELDGETERTDSRMRSLNTKLRHIATDSDRGKYCVIVLLLIVLIILILLVLA